MNFVEVVPVNDGRTVVRVSVPQRFQIVDALSLQGRDTRVLHLFENESM